MIHIYTHIYKCMYMYIYIHVFMYIMCMYVHIYIYIHMRIHVYTLHIHIHVFICICRVYIEMYQYTYKDIIRIHTYTYTHTHTYVYIYKSHLTYSPSLCVQPSPLNHAKYATERCENHWNTHKCEKNTSNITHPTKKYELHTGWRRLIGSPKL